MTSSSPSSNKPNSPQSPSPQNGPKKSGMSTGAKIAIGCVVIIMILGVCAVIASLLGLSAFSKVINEFEKNAVTYKTEIEDNDTTEIDPTETDEFNNPNALGDTVDVNGVEWTLLTAEDIGAELDSVVDYTDAKCTSTLGKYILVTLKIANNTDEVIATYGFNLVDNDGNTYEAATNVFNCEDQDALFVFDSINQGVEKNFSEVFDVSEEAEGLRLVVSDLQYLDETVDYIDLGL